MYTKVEYYFKTAVFHTKIFEVFEIKIWLKLKYRLAKCVVSLEQLMFTTFGAFSPNNFHGAVQKKVKTVQ